MGVDRSMDELRRESEQTRAVLAATVTELRDRSGAVASDVKTLLSPTHIKQEIRSYIREERESVTRAVRRKMRENPLQTAAVGAALAYPALGLLRAIPGPLWLIAGGLFLTTDRGRQATSEAKVKIDSMIQSGSDALSHASDALQSEVTERLGQARTEMHEMGEAVATAAGSLKDQARTAFHDAKDTLGAAAAEVPTMAAQAGDALSRARPNAGAVDVDPHHASAPAAVKNFVQDYPLVVAGLGVALGIFLAASIPSSEAENRLFGAGSDKLKARARQAANDGLEKAGDLASEAIEATTAAVVREGLNASGVKTAVSKVSDGVIAVAERGVNAAMGRPAIPSSSPGPRASERN